MERILAGDMRVGGLRVIAVHLGTNSMDYKGWGGKVSWQGHLASLQEEFRVLYQSIRRFIATCFIVFSAVLPRGYDWQHTRELYLCLTASCRALLETTIVAICPHLHCLQRGAKKAMSNWKPVCCTRQGPPLKSGGVPIQGVQGIHWLIQNGSVSEASAQYGSGSGFQALGWGWVSGRREAGSKHPLWVRSGMRAWVPSYPPGISGAWGPCTLLSRLPCSGDSPCWWFIDHCCV